MTPPRLDEGSERLIALALKCGAFQNDGSHGIPAGTLITFEPEELVQFAAALSTGRLGGDALVINATQLRSALELAAPDFDTDEDQREQEVVIQRLPARTSTEGEPMEAGLYCWLADYPEEGCIPLREDEAFPAPAAKPQGDRT